METIINQELKIESSIAFANIQSFTIDWEINQHATLNLYGNIQNTTNWENMLSQCKASNIKIIYLAAEKKEEVLFHGIVKNVELSIENQMMSVDIAGITATENLDRKKRDMSFQNVSMTYADIAREIIAEGNGKVICTVGKDRKTKKPLIKYQETDWEYLKRLASHLSKYLVADIITGRPNVWFGMREGDKINVSGEEVVQVVVEKTYGKSNNAKTLITYRIHSRNNYYLGDRCIIQGREYCLYKKKVIFYKGEVIFEYIFAVEENIHYDILYNRKFPGLSLVGIVEKTDKEFVYITLDIDGCKGAYPYPWKPESGNVLYAMPEVGTKVCLYLPDYDERNGFGVRCLDMKWGSDKKVCNKTFKSFHKGNVSLCPSEISINIGGDEIEENLVMNDESGLQISSNSMIDISAKGKILIRADKICIVTQTKIDMTTS